MSLPGTKVPPSRFPKSATAETRLPAAPGCKCLKDENISFDRGDIAELKSDNGPTAPTSRVYTRDYSKVTPAPDDQDLVSGALGRPAFRL